MLFSHRQGLNNCNCGKSNFQDYNILFIAIDGLIVAP